MLNYNKLSKSELESLREELNKEYENAKAKNLKLDMSRGKPNPSQLDISNDVAFALGTDFKDDTGFDCRNYGILEGIPSARRLMAELLDVESENIIIYGNSSLNLMYDTVARSFTHGVLGNTPWSKLDKVKFLCVVPGYDRHFAITQFFGIENINIPMLEDGPDMDLVEKLLASDESIKGIWCVPKYSNPTGNSYSDEVVKRLANLKPAAKDFRIYWDNAYVVHHLYEDDKDEVLNIITECKKAGNEDMVFEFCSTSKVSFAGSGISAIATSIANIEDMKAQMKFQTIGHDKLNQLRHVRYFKNIDGINAHMKKLADSLRPKFVAVDDILNKELAGLGIATWTKPRGGYFISFDTMKNCAKAVVRKLAEAGVVMTGAGATFPGGKDPEDKNIRIAPSYPSVEEIKQATELLCLCTKLVSVEKLLEN